MPENLFEKIDRLGEQQRQASEQATIDKQEILDAINKLHSGKTAADQSQIAQVNAKLALQNFFKNSDKEYHFFGNEEDFSKSKRNTLLSLFACLTIGVFMNVLTSLGCGLFSTFTLIEDLWLFLVFKMICHTFYSKRYYDHVDYSCHSFEKFVVNADYLYVPQKVKISYKIIRVLAVISVVCNIIYLCMNAKGAITVWAIIFELLFLGSIALSMYMMVNHFCMYTLVYYTGKNASGNQSITIIHDTTANQLYAKEDYESKFPFIK